MATDADPALIKNLLDALDTLSGTHPGFRPVHAKGVFCTGTFTPAPGAAGLTRADHARRPSTPVVVRFSAAAGLPTIPDNDLRGAGPRGIAIRFHLADHVHTDIVAHSHNGFPVHTGEEFLEFLRAVPLSGPDAPKPTPLETFFGTHPRAFQFATAPKPIPTSYARESFFAVTAFKFTNDSGATRFGRFRIAPAAGNEYLSPEDAEKKSADFLSDELGERLAHGPVVFHIRVQLAAAGDDVTDASAVWPNDREVVEFGTITLTQQADAHDPELWKIIFDPIPRVAGIDSAGDPLTEIRSAIYLMSGRRRRAAGPHS
ncbi:catalase family peroxidase [Fimbriiglobus ruber]|uniref:Catalase-related peroxidase n=1 Tax=Fimbriiglobus ruber TaxID=1908690 RepID=A0A225DWS5_9BACT|nr:catalase family peroxidase [Fimbriiglobus ruber]OWK40775.1 Catalase [Fimbriiglobus ruber]